MEVIKDIQVDEQLSAPATPQSTAPLNTGRKQTGKDLSTYREIEERDPIEVSLRSLLQAGVHFGHQTSRWNPKMTSFIHSAKNGIHIINLPKTLQSWETARKAIVDLVTHGGNVLFVGTKKQAQDTISQEARRCGANFVSHRWLGGMLTNFQTIRRSIERMKKLEQILAEEEKLLASGTPSKYTKKERLMMSRELEKLDFSLGGIKDMYRLPDLLFVVDVQREDIAVKEAKRLDLPVVALVDTNCDPTDITYPIPSNDDGSKAIKLFSGAVADAVMAGRRLMKEQGFSVNDKPEIDEAKVAPDKTFASHKFETQTEGGLNSDVTEPI